MKKLFKLVSSFVLLAVSAYSTSTSAAVVIDFSTGLAGSGGTISYDGANVVGTDILIGGLLVEGAPVGNGTYVVDALLDFDTAANTIEIFGTVETLVGIPQILLTGSFDSFSYTADAFGNEIFSGTGPDIKSCALLCELGLPPDLPFNFFGFSVEAANGNVVSTDIVNTAVPVPAAVWLFGTGLLGLVGVARRRA